MGKVQVNLRLPVELVKEAKIICINEKTNMTEVVYKLLNRFVEENKK